uniref:Piezo_RRas_bdg domain-containing protein n=1 Tax=Macrostomum lignano TaxID=282301 RepID=A0A1I8ILG3_9PLAT
MLKPQVWLSFLKGCTQLILFLGSLLRYNLFSLVYLVFLLVSPLVPFHKEKPFLIYNGALLACSGLFTLAQIVFQIVLAAYPPYGSLVSDCSLDLALRQIGLQSFADTQAQHLVRLLLAEPLTLIVSAVSIGIGTRNRGRLFQSYPAASAAAPPSPEQSVVCAGIDATDGVAATEAQQVADDHHTLSMGLRKLRSMLLHFLLLCILCSCAVCSPSVTTSVYIVAFLLALLVWSIGGPGPDSLAIERARQCMAMYAALHLLVVFCYQLPVTHHIQGLEPNSTAARMMGLYYMIESNCSTNEVYFDRQIRANEYIEPLLLIGFYFFACMVMYLWKTDPYRRRRSTLTLCPLLALYGTGLLMVNFVFNFDLQDIYLAGLNASQLRQAGLQIYPQPWATFSAQAAFCCAFFVGVWSLVAGRRLIATAAVPSAAPAAPVDSSSSTSSLRMRRVGGQQQQSRQAFGASGRRVETLLVELMSKYSVLVCCIFWLLMCSWLDVNVNRVIVMAMFLYFLFTFRVSFSFWKRQLLAIFIILVLYSMLVLLLIYAYQFDSVPEFITKITSLQPAVPRGRDSTDNAGLQDDENDDVADEDGQNVEEAGSAARGTVKLLQRARLLLLLRNARQRNFNTLLLRLNQLYNAYSMKFSPTVWRLMEVHWWKIVGLVIVCVAVSPIEGSNFDASNLIYAGLLPLYLLAPEPVSIVYLAWSSLLILAKMIYQLNLVRDPLAPYAVKNCTANSSKPDGQSNATSLPEGIYADNFRYFGLHVPNGSGSDSLFPHLMLHASIVVCLAVQHIVRLKQRHRRLLNGESGLAPKHNLIFPEFTFIEFEAFYCQRWIRVATVSIEAYCPLGHSFFANFFGYKLGLELSCIAIVISAGLRLDIFSCVYLLFLLLFNFLRRDTIRKLWPLLHLLVGIGFSLQFCLACGIPPMLCLKYPWFDAVNNVVFSDNARQWLFLPAYGVPPRAEKLIGE